MASGARKPTAAARAVEQQNRGWWWWRRWRAKPRQRRRRAARARRVETERRRRESIVAHRLPGRSVSRATSSFVRAVRLTRPQDAHEERVVAALDRGACVVGEGHAARVEHREERGRLERARAERRARRRDVVEREQPAPHLESPNRPKGEERVREGARWCRSRSGRVLHHHHRKREREMAWRCEGARVFSTTRASSARHARHARGRTRAGGRPHAEQRHAAHMSTRSVPPRRRNRRSRRDDAGRSLPARPAARARRPAARRARRRACPST